MNTVVIKLSEMYHPENNVRYHPETQLKEYRRSLTEFGQIRPIILDENHIIRCGNGLYEAMLSMGYEQADCWIVHNLDENKKKKLMLADNRISVLGVDNMQVFDEIIAELGMDYSIPGYDDELLKSLVADTPDIDEMMSGYGIINEEDKSRMQAAEQKYQREEEGIAETAQQYVPKTVNDDSRGSEPVYKQETHSTSINHSEPENAQESKLEPLQHRFMICPKCGEKIWL